MNKKYFISLLHRPLLRGSGRGDEASTLFGLTSPMRRSPIRYLDITADCNLKTHKFNQLLIAMYRPCHHLCQRQLSRPSEGGQRGDQRTHHTSDAVQSLGEQHSPHRPAVSPREPRNDHILSRAYTEKRACNSPYSQNHRT